MTIIELHVSILLRILTFLNKEDNLKTKEVCKYFYENNLLYPPYSKKSIVLNTYFTTKHGWILILEKSHMDLMYKNFIKDIIYKKDSKTFKNFISNDSYHYKKLIHFIDSSYVHKDHLNFLLNNLHEIEEICTIPSSLYKTIEERHLYLDWEREWEREWERKWERECERECEREWDLFWDRAERWGLYN